MASRTRARRSPVAVVIPWRPGCPHREAALDYVTARWAQLGADELELGRHDDGPWCKALAVHDGIARTRADIVVIADADVWCDGFPDAIAAVEAGAPWAVPHYLVHRLTEAATRDVLAGTEPHPAMPLAVLRKPYAGRLGGGVVALRRDVWGGCPLDARFRGWGHEDDSWALALGHLHGPPVQYRTTLWHLWHPPQQRINWGLGSEESDALYKRYCAAARNPNRDEMRALVAEGAPTHAPTEVTRWTRPKQRNSSPFACSRRSTPRSPTGK